MSFIVQKFLNALSSIHLSGSIFLNCTNQVPKTTINVCTFVTGVKPTSWCLLRPLYNGFFQLVPLYYSTLGQHVFFPGHVPRRLRIRKKPFAKVRPVCCFATSKYPAIFSLFKLLNLISNFVFFHRLDLANTSLNIFRLKFFNE